MVNCSNAQKVQAHLCFKRRGGVCVIWLTGVWKAPNYLQVFPFYFARTDVLGYMWKYLLLMVSKCSKWERGSPEQGGGVQLLAQEPLPSLQIEALASLCLCAAVTDYFLWSLDPHFPALQSFYTMVLAQTLCNSWALMSLVPVSVYPSLG